MSWARYWAPRARAPLKRKPATPFAARSWLTRLNSTPAEPPTLTGGGAGFGGAGRTGAGRAATGAGAAAGPGGAAGPGVGGAWSTSLARSCTPPCRGRSKATLALVSRVATTAWGRWDPTTATTAAVSSGMLRISVTRVTERDNSNPPCDLSAASEDSRPRQAAKPSHQGPEKPSSRAIAKVPAGLSGGSGDEEEQLTEELSWEDDDHRQVKEAGRRHERPQAAGRERQACRHQGQDHRAQRPEDREHGTQAQRMTHRAGAAAHATEGQWHDDGLQHQTDQQD